MGGKITMVIAGWEGPRVLPGLWLSYRVDECPTVPEMDDCWLLLA